MKLEEFDKFYHVDIAAQIDNKWKDNTALGIVKDSRKFSILIKGRDKEIIRRRFISNGEDRPAKRHNHRVIAIIYSYLLFKAIIEFSEANPLLICRDVRPEIVVINYLKKISRFFGNSKVFERKIKFRKRIEFETEAKLPKSLAGKYARKVYQGKIPANKTLQNYEIDELIDLIGRIL